MKKTFILILMVITALMLAACTNSSAPSPQLSAAAVSSVAGSVAGEVKEVHIDMYNFGFTQDPVTIKKGDKVSLRITSSSGIHGIAVPGLGIISKPLAPGEEQVIEFVAAKSGSFDYYCNVPCGSGHRKMQSALVIEE